MFCDRCALPQRGKGGGHAVRSDPAQSRMSQGRNHIVPPVARIEKLLPICPRNAMARCDLASVLDGRGQHRVL